jgi:PAS domain S-box-containing protein
MEIHKKIIAAMEASWLIQDLDELLETSLSFLLQLSYVHHITITLFDQTDNLVPVATAENVRYGAEISQKINVQSYVLNAYVRHSIRRIIPPRYQPTFCFPLLKHDGLLGLMTIRFTHHRSHETTLLKNLNFFAQHLGGKIREILKMQEIEDAKHELGLIRRHGDETLQQVTALSKELYAITAISTKINQSMDVQKSLRKSVVKVKKVFDAQGILIYKRTILQTGWEMSHRDMGDALFSRLVHRKIEAFFLEEIAKTGKPLQMRGNDNFFFEPMKKNGYKNPAATIIGVPMKSKEKTHGVLLLFLEADRPFNSDNLRLLSGMGNIMGMAVENMALFHRAEAKTRESAFLVDSIAKFNEKLDLEKTLKSVAEKGAQLVGESCCIYLFSETRHPMIHISCQGNDEAPVPKAHSTDKIEPGELRSLYRSMKSEKKPILIREMGRSRRISKETKTFFKTGDVRSLIIMPLRFGGKTLGLIILGRTGKKRHFDRHDFALSKALGSAAAVAIQNSWTYAQSLEMSDLLERKVREKSTQIQQLHDKQTRRFETRDDITFWVNNRNEFVFVNRAMETLTGVSRETLCGGNISTTDVVFEKDRSWINDCFRRILIGEAPFFTDLTYRHRNWKGDDHIISLTIYPAKEISGKIIGVEGIGRDITETKMLEAELEKAKNLALLGEFSSAVAHQIRNPLSNILMGMNLLQKSLITEDNGLFVGSEKAAAGTQGSQKGQSPSEMFGNLKEGVNNLNRVVTEILQYTRTLKLSLSMQQMGMVIEETLNRLQNDIRGKNIRVQKHFDSNLPPVRLDAVLMGQVLQNIIQNSIEAMSKGGTLEIFFGPAEQKENHAKIAVKDSGTGLAPSETEKIFHPLYTTKASGTGLGLSISHRIIEAHQGTMWATHNPEKGMTVHILLPMNPHEQKADAEGRTI